MTKKILHTWTLNDSNDSKNKSTNEKKVVQLTNWIKFKLNKTKLSNEQKKNNSNEPKNSSHDQKKLFKWSKK